MISVTPMTAEDAMRIRPIQQPQAPVLEAGDRVAQLMHKSLGEDVWSFRKEGRLLAIGGLGFPSEGRMIAWILLDEECGKWLLPLTRFLRVFIDEYHSPRVEMHVCAGFGAGEKWARLLGFTNETPMPMRRFFPDGSDAYLYARVT